MTLKLRLAAMMMFLVMAVVAAQFLLNAREQRDLEDRIARINDEVNLSTRQATERVMLAVMEDDRGFFDTLTPVSSDSGFSATRATVRFRHVGDDLQHVVTHAIADRDSVRELIAELEELPLDLDGCDSIRTEVFVFADEGDSLFWSEQPGHVWHQEVDDRTITTRYERRSLADSLRPGKIVVDVETAPDALIPPFPRAVAESTMRGRLAELTARFGPRRTTHDEFLFEVPFFYGQKDSLAVFEVRYPLAELTDALAASRRRGVWLVSSLLGLGAVGAGLMAVQFTRPLRRLERSFERVESGDLDVDIAVERRDEIGRLTTSFNRMVGRLRQTKAIEQQLAEAERLATVGRLAAGVAHEVRNPLNTIQLTMQQLRDKTAPPGGTDERAAFDRYFSSVTGELHRLEKLVSDVLVLSSAETLHTESIDLVASVRAAVTLFEADAQQRGVRLAVEATEPISLDGDPSALSTVWNNLLANALAATDPGGDVTVTIGSRCAGMGGAPEEDDVAVVTVRDTGRGMSPDEVAHVFDPFYTARPDGTGLGLAIVRSAVERHGGHIDVESAPEAGTVMRVHLPRNLRA